MKRILLMIGFLASFNAFAQTDSLKLTGHIKFTANNKYVFIYDLNSKKQYFQPINGKDFAFAFKKPCEMENEQIAIFLGPDSTKTYEEVKKTYAFLPKSYRMLIFENNTTINIADEIDSAQVRGGQLNIDLDDMRATIRNKKYQEFFSSHPDAPIAITFLKALLKFRGHRMFNERIDYEKCFSALGNTLQQSTEGKELKILVYGK